VVVWEFEVKPGCEPQFVSAYGPDGAWAQLFRKSPEFLGVELTRSVGHPARFFTFDMWASKAAFEAFCEQNSAAYTALDQKLSGLTEWERRVGAFPSE
jgi:heme-degrading monooxygenase HmoA